MVEDSDVYLPIVPLREMHALLAQVRRDLRRIGCLGTPSFAIALTVLAGLANGQEKDRRFLTAPQGAVPLDVKPVSLPTGRFTGDFQLDFSRPQPLPPIEGISRVSVMVAQGGARATASQ